MPDPSTSSRIVVIGAGVAGLNAARLLAAQGLDVLVVEARDRTGGRILTRRDARSPLPIELGAEFVHGRAEPLEQVLHAAALHVVDISGSRGIVSGRTVRRLDDYWQRLDAVMQKVTGGGGADRSFAERVRARRRGIRPSDLRLVRQYVEGFHAADTREVSARALAESGSPQGDVRERRLGRVLEGYDRLVEWLAAPVSDRILLSTVVTRIAWARHRVRVETCRGDGTPGPALEARAVLITVPVGVLQAPAGTTGAIPFAPALPRKQAAIERLAMGAVVRVTWQFHERFWASKWFAAHARNDALDTLSFLHTGDDRFPIWWTAYPVRAPRMVSWLGGPHARELSRESPQDIERLALESLARRLRLSPRTLRELVDGAWTYDWEHDPFARGAYSYQRVGGANAPQALARPVMETLFFAGEATDTEGSTGTVHGALGSATRAVAEIVRAVRRR